MIKANIVGCGACPSAISSVLTRDVNRPCVHARMSVHLTVRQPADAILHHALLHLHPWFEARSPCMWMCLRKQHQQVSATLIRACKPSNERISIGMATT
jgi:hypothetical protein